MAGERNANLHRFLQEKVHEQFTLKFSDVKSDEEIRQAVSRKVKTIIESATDERIAARLLLEMDDADFILC